MKTSNNLSERVKNGRNGVQFVYVLDAIRNSGRAADEGKDFATDRDALLFFWDSFNAEFNDAYNKKRYRNLQARIANYLQGLPSCIAVDYWNDDIINIGRAWGFCQTERKAAQFVENWFNVIALRIIQASDKVGINTFAYIF